jgi:hypothetical protein
MGVETAGAASLIGGVMVVLAVICLGVWVVREGGRKYEEAGKNLFSEAARRLKMEYSQEDRFQLKEKLEALSTFGPAFGRGPANIAVRMGGKATTFLFEYRQRGLTGHVAAIFTIALVEDDRLPANHMVVVQQAHERYKKWVRSLFGEDVQDVEVAAGSTLGSTFWVFSDQPTWARAYLSDRRGQLIGSSLRGFKPALAIELVNGMLFVHTREEKKRVRDVEGMVQLMKRTDRIHKGLVEDTLPPT